jgi:hypothetical protein
VFCIGRNLNPIPGTQQELRSGDIKEQLALGNDAHLTEGVAMFRHFGFGLIDLFVGFKAFVFKDHMNLSLCWRQGRLPSSD